jgi:hypothetical protein
VIKSEPEDVRPTGFVFPSSYPLPSPYLGIGDALPDGAGGFIHTFVDPEGNLCTDPLLPEQSALLAAEAALPISGAPSGGDCGGDCGSGGDPPAGDGGERDERYAFHILVYVGSCCNGHTQFVVELLP